MHSSPLVPSWACLESGLIVETFPSNSWNLSDFHFERCFADLIDSLVNARIMTKDTTLPLGGGSDGMSPVMV
jgi:hypothetical protein